MKKLMIVAAIVCVAVMSQAAQLNWSSVALDKDGNKFTGGQAYLIMLTGTTRFAVADDLMISGGSIVVAPNSVRRVVG